MNNTRLQPPAPDRKALLAEHHQLAEYSFMPHDGYCYACSGDILTEVIRRDQLSRPVTGCPLCHRSLVG